MEESEDECNTNADGDAAVLAARKAAADASDEAMFKQSNFTEEQKDGVYRRAETQATAATKRNHLRIGQTQT